MLLHPFLFFVKGSTLLPQLLSDGCQTAHMLLTTSMFSNPVSTRVFNSSQPMPPAPTASTLAALICVPHTAAAVCMQYSRLQGESYQVLPCAHTCALNKISYVTLAEKAFVNSRPGHSELPSAGNAAAATAAAMVRAVPAATA
jgi:hypothetical protein